MQTLRLIAQDLGAQLEYDECALDLTVRMRTPGVAVGSRRSEFA